MFNFLKPKYFIRKEWFGDYLYIVTYREWLWFGKKMLYVTPANNETVLHINREAERLNHGKEETQ
jgi:hypothetical protein